MWIIHIHVCVYLRVYICIIYVYMYICICIYVCIYIYICDPGRDEAQEHVHAAGGQEYEGDEGEVLVDGLTITMIMIVVII